MKIAGLSTYVPPRVLTNLDLEKLVETSNEWILQRTGIRERHIVDPGVATSDLAKEASIGAMRQAGVDPTDIGFIDSLRVLIEAQTCAVEAPGAAKVRRGGAPAAALSAVGAPRSGRGSGARSR